MDNMIKTKNSASELNKKIEQHLEELAQMTDEARVSAEMVRYLDFCAKFHQYSPSNVWLILLAKPDATHIAGFHAWKKMGRFVKRGEKGIPIFAPIFRREDSDDKDLQKVLGGFRVVYVFDISQTDGQPIPNQPNWKSPEKNLELQQRLMNFAKLNGIQVTIEELEGETQGVSRGGSIILSPEAGTKTLVHEIAHELLHQVEKNRLSRAEREMEAEAVGFIVSKCFEIDELSSSSYLSLYGISSDMILADYERIQQCASQIIEYVLSE